MARPPVPADEADRLARPRRLGALDVPARPGLDALARAAAALCGTPISLVSLIDADRQWFAANVGLPGVTETTRDESLCAYVVGLDAPLETTRPLLDPRFAGNRQLIEAGIEFYAGFPIRVGPGSPIGTLCVVDRCERHLEDWQRVALEHLADVAASLLGGEGEPIDVQHARAEVAERERLRTTIDALGAARWEADLADDSLTVDDRFVEILGWPRDDPAVATMRGLAAVTHADDVGVMAESIRRVLRGDIDRYETIVRVRHHDGHWKWVRTLGAAGERAVDGRVLTLRGVITDASDELDAERAAAVGRAMLARAGRLAHFGGWVIDLALGEVRWTDETARVLGLASGAVAPLGDWLEMFPPDVRPVLEQRLAGAIERGEAWDIEVPIRRAVGGDVWVRVVGEREDDDGVAARIVGAVQDVTEHRLLQARVAQGDELLRVLFASIAEAVVTTDGSGRVQWLNRAAQEMTGWAPADAAGRPIDDVVRVTDQGGATPVPVLLNDAVATGAAVQVGGEPMLVARNGTCTAVELTATPMVDGRTTRGVALVIRDVSEQRRLDRELSHRAHHDALTGLWNRAYLEQSLASVIEDASSFGTVHTLLYIDLDHFKLVNDACGHPVGDLLLRQVSGLLRGCVRASDQLARLGGDEFAVILHHCTVEQGRRVSDEICRRIDEFRFVHDGQRFRVGASIGLVTIDDRWRSTAEVLQAADSACYAAKHAGRNRSHVWTDSDEALQVRSGQTRWASRIEHSLDDGAFELHAQRIVPIVFTEDGLRAEVLLRMRDADGRVVAPGAFLPAAERYQLASRIDRWVIRHLVDLLESLPADAAAGITSLSVNLSGQSVADRAFQRFVLDAFATTSFDPRRICAELTETAAITQLDEAASFFADLRTLGVKVALDDFGAGASSFGYLTSFPVDYLKIDGQFVRDLVEDPLDLAAVRCFHEVARVIGVSTVAEYVDRPEVLSALAEIGVDYAQGYLMHRPEPLAGLLGIDDRPGVEPGLSV